MANVKFDSVKKVYDGNVIAIGSLDLDIQDGEFMVLVGPSGCGKSTALRMIAGLEEVTSGELSIGDIVVNDVPPADRDIAMVFQNYALYPHMTVRENMGFSLEVSGVKKKEMNRRVEETAEILGLQDYLDRLPKALSGGQQQRVAMGRAIVRSPKVFLMDEPLSNLDAKLRVQMRSEVIQLQKRLGTTMVYVTHDQVEAMTMGSRVAVMRGGELQQVASPQELYREPANLFVAAFIGSPSMNLLTGRVTGSGDALGVEFAGHSLALESATIERYPRLRDAIGDDVVVGIRPEHFEMADDSDAPADHVISVETDLTEAMGAENHVHFFVDVDGGVEALESVRADTADGDELESLDTSKGRTEVVARVDGMHVIEPGQRVELSVKTDRIHFFACDDGSPLR
ncbi:MAG: sn-glycerol-3-phosphate ABC transporter ATP-binding protein UgpC [Ilumatobacter sp.]|uniref:ABC transporter ATP-binding protein n=1 Tax=Ilumatobacter sp. TaxID=1967498 RepID=UPI003C72375E